MATVTDSGYKALPGPGQAGTPAAFAVAAGTPPSMQELLHAGKSYSTSVRLSRGRNWPWKKCVVLGVSSMLVGILVLGSLLNIIVATKMMPALHAANGAVVKIDLMYAAFSEALRILCALPNKVIPPELYPLLCVAN